LPSFAVFETDKFWPTVSSASDVNKTTSLKTKTKTKNKVGKSNTNVIAADNV